MKLDEILTSNSQSEWLLVRGMSIDHIGESFRIISHNGRIIKDGLNQKSLLESIEHMIDASADLYEMANLDSETTGLPMYIFCSPRGNAKHECRIKVCNTKGKMNEDDTFSIDVHTLEIRGECRLSADDLERVKWWIHYNKFDLLDFWKGKINTKKFLNSVKNIMNVNVSQNIKNNKNRR
jgi:hypothetical protein